MAPPARSDFVYLNYGAVTLQQGCVPPEAFAGEDEVHKRIRAIGNVASVRGPIH